MTRRAGRGFLSIGAVAIAASCGGCSGPRDAYVGGAGAAGSFEGGAVGDVVVGDDEAWIVTRDGGRASELHVWRLDLAAPRAEQLGEVPGMQGAEVAPGPHGIDVAGWRCADRGASGCTEAAAVLVRLDQAGEQVDEVTLVAKPGSVDPSDSVAVVGRGPASVWIAAHGSVVEVGDDGSIREAVPSSQGEPCLIGGELYGLVAPSENSYAVLEHRGDWRPVDDRAFVEIPGPGGLTARCGDGRYEVVAEEERLVATWTRSGWALAEARSDLPSDAGPQIRTFDDRFGQSPDGRVSERTRAGTWEPTELELPVPPADGADLGRVSLVADSSERLVAGCISWGIDERVASCAIAAR